MESGAPRTDSRTRHRPPAAGGARRGRCSKPSPHFFSVSGARFRSPEARDAGLNAPTGRTGWRPLPPGRETARLPGGVSGSGRRTMTALALNSSTQADARRFRSRSSSRLRIRISTSPNAAGDPESGSRSSTVRHYSSTSRWRPSPEAESAGQPIGPRRVPAGSASANSPRLSQDGEASPAVVLRRCETVDQRPQGSLGLLFGRWLLQIPARFVPASRGQSTKATRTTPPRAGTFRRTRGFIAGARHAHNCPPVSRCGGSESPRPASRLRPARGST